MRLTRAVKHMISIEGNIVKAQPIFDWKRRQHELAKVYKKGSWDSTTVA